MGDARGPLPTSRGRWAQALPTSRGRWAQDTADVAWAMGAGHCRRRVGDGRRPCRWGQATGDVVWAMGAGPADVAWADARRPLPTSHVAWALGKSRGRCGHGRRARAPAFAYVVGARLRPSTRRLTLEVHSASEKTSSCDIVVGHDISLGMSLGYRNALDGTENLRSRPYYFGEVAGRHRNSSYIARHFAAFLRAM